MLEPPATPEEVEQLARSMAMAPTLGDRDRHRVVDLLRELARLLVGRT